MILISGEALIDLIPDPVKADAYDAVLEQVPPTTSPLGWLGSARRPLSSRAFLRTGMAKRSPGPSPRAGWT